MDTQQHITRITPAISPKEVLTFNRVPDVRDALKTAAFHPERTRPIRLVDLESMAHVDADMEINAMCQADYVGRAFLGEDKYFYAHGSIWQEPRKTLVGIYGPLSEKTIEIVLSNLEESPKFQEMCTKYGDKIDKSKLTSTVTSAIRRNISSQGINLETGVQEAFASRIHTKTEASSIVLSLARQLIPSDRVDQNITREDIELSWQLLAEQLSGNAYDITSTLEQSVSPAQRDAANQKLHEGFVSAMKDACSDMQYAMRNDSRAEIGKSIGGVFEEKSPEMGAFLEEISVVASELIDTDPTGVAASLVSNARRKLAVKQDILARHISENALELRATRWERARATIRNEIDRRIPQDFKTKFRDWQAERQAWETDFFKTDSANYRFPVNLPQEMETALANVPENDREALTARLTTALQHPSSFEEIDTIARPIAGRESLLRYVGGSLAGAAASTAGIFLALGMLPRDYLTIDLMKATLAGTFGPLLPIGYWGGRYKEGSDTVANKAVVQSRLQNINDFMQSEGIK